jgi:hypothetical protein
MSFHLWIVIKPRFKFQQVVRCRFSWISKKKDKNENFADYLKFLKLFTEE